MDLPTLLRFLCGLVLLILGAEALVRGASRLAAAAGVSSLVIGLTVVAFGTSAPELAVSVGSALHGEAALAVGNVVGSNVFNVLFILGISALITPLVVSPQLVRLDVPVMIAASAATWWFAHDGDIGRDEGGLMFVAALVYTGLLVRMSRRSRVAPAAVVHAEAGEQAERPRGLGALLKNVGLVAVGLAMLVLGSRWLVLGAVALARALHVDEVVIGLTVVAAGTSLPEVATSVLAALRGERDIAVGNVVGSNIFNLLWVLGLSAAVSPGGLDVTESLLRFDLPFMVAVAVACLPIFFTGHVIARWEGALFLGYYVAYTLYLVLDAKGAVLLPRVHDGIVWVAAPATAVVLLIAVLRELSVRRAARA